MDELVSLSAAARRVAGQFRYAGAVAGSAAVGGRTIASGGVGLDLVGDCLAVAGAYQGQRS
ncbi:hypothetical protein SAZ10_29815 [Mesorhizobium sp. BAC0120]|uniref:hypothetical protein n=1 Tax=Mesorhizobium sp. BAC0120 TaxID=3090670 RepID=UPI00298C8E98|nr:hypothetical protein [Mesorhizobium sp. BAC0120]MDW6025963.1 hypothetical protein [Mesorhizobium sp. BAC0120]